MSRSSEVRDGPVRMVETVLAAVLVLREVQNFLERRAAAAERTRLSAAALARTPEAAVAAVQGLNRKRKTDPENKKPPLPIGL